MNHVIVIEDEHVLRALMVQGLAKLPGISVRDAGTLQEGLALLDEHSVDLIISDIDLPRRSGLELLGELGRRNLRTPVLFVSAYLKAYGPQIPPNANIELLEKPVALELLRARVKARLKVTPSARTPFSVADYLQLACMGRHTVRIDITCADGSSAAILIIHGEVWSARDAQGEGVDAFHRCAFLPDSAVECKTESSPVETRNIHAPWEGLLLDAARLRDEAERTAPKVQEPAAGASSIEDGFSDFEDAPAPEPAEPPAPASPPAVVDEDSPFNALLEDGVAAMLRRDLPSASVIFQRALQLKPTHPLVLANIKRLTDLGHPPGVPPVGGRP